MQQSARERPFKRLGKYNPSVGKRIVLLFLAYPGNKVTCLLLLTPYLPLTLSLLKANLKSVGNYKRGSYF